MSFPLIAIVPSFFIVMLALPVLIVTESPASIDEVLADLERVVLVDLCPPAGILQLVLHDVRRFLPSLRLFSADVIVWPRLLDRLGGADADGV